MSKSLWPIFAATCRPRLVSATASTRRCCWPRQRPKASRPKYGSRFAITQFQVLIFERTRADWRSRSKKETARVLDNRQSCDRHHIARQKRPLFFDGFDIFASAGLLGLVNPAAALGDEALGKRGEGCRASPLLRRGRTVQTLANVYEDR